MKLTHDACYKAVKSQDSRFDGQFYTAVKTTGIYCRPICKVPAPKSENCTFYPSPQLAEHNGYRPCLRCRPEMAPSYSEFNQNEGIIKDILDYFESNNYKTKLVTLCANYLGITSRHLNRVFNETLGMNPQDYIISKRLLRAKTLLSTTNLKVSEIALEVGFGSTSRFNAALKKHYHLTPTDIRKSNKSTKNLMLKLYYRPPYDWDMILNFYSIRSIPGVESVSDGKYRRTLSINRKEEYSGWLEVTPFPDEHYLQLTVSRTLEPVLLDVIKGVKRAFDLDLSPDQLPDDLPLGIRLPGCFDAFEMCTRAILGQQITVKAARTLTGRLVDALGEKVETPHAGLTHHFPSVRKILSLSDINDSLGVLGIIQTRSQSILGIANGIDNGSINFINRHNPDLVRASLINIKGIGPWTAEYFVMRGLSWPDAFPISDIGVKHGLKPYLKDGEQLLLDNPRGLSKYKLNKLYEKQGEEFASSYRPWRSYLTIALWYALNGGKLCLEK